MIEYLKFWLAEALISVAVGATAIAILIAFAWWKVTHSKEKDSGIWQKWQ